MINRVATNRRDGSFRKTSEFRHFRTLAIVLAAFCLGTPVWSQGLETQTLFDQVARLYDAAGLVLPTVSTPVTAREVSTFLQRLADSSASSDLRMEATSLLRDLRSRVDSTFISTEFSFSPEYYLNIDRPDFTTQSAIEAPVAGMGLGYGRINGPYFYIKAVLQREWVYSTAATNIPAPVPGNPVPFENNFVSTGYLFLPVGLADVTFGRQPVSIGPDLRDSLLVSSRIPFLDALKVTIEMNGLKMTSLTSTIDNGRAQPDTAGTATSSYGFDISTIFYNVHYFEYAWSRVRVGIGSQVVLARDINNFHLGDFFPVFSWHNADIVPNNMSLVADVTVAPLPGTEVFLQIGYDDISGEAFGIGDSAVPTIDAYIGGASVRLPCFDAEVAVVGGYTHYLWGNFDLDEFLGRAIYRLESDGPHRSAPLTSPYGPGALWVDLQLGASWGGLSSTLAYLALGRKPGANIYSTPYASSDVIEAAAYNWSHRVALELAYDVAEFATISVTPQFTIADGVFEPGLEISGTIARRRERIVFR